MREEREGARDAGTAVSDTVKTPSRYGRHASLERSGKREELIERWGADKGHRLWRRKGEGDSDRERERLLGLKRR